MRSGLSHLSEGACPMRTHLGAIPAAALLGLMLVAAGTTGYECQRATPADPSSVAASPEQEFIAVNADKPNVQYRELTPEEERVIVGKGTEPPFSGTYDRFFEAGVYTCRRCGAMLYRSEDKFDSGCGWPAFDDGVPGAVRREVDADGVRTEILCANCGAHLGHVFTGEELTPKDTRHCVNSISLQLVPADQVTYGRAIVAGGCFWGVEYWMRRLPGVLRTTVGYTGGTTENPTYGSLHRTGTGHAEAVEVLFDPVRVSYEGVLKLFFEIHDPTQVDGQGPDIGREYRSAVFYLDDSQRETAERLISELREKGLNVATEVTSAGAFWPAEDYHQEYLDKRGAEPACHVPRKLW